MDVEWQSTRNSNYVRINSRVGRMQADLVHKLKYNQGDRVIFGFSDDRDILVIRKSENGLKLSLTTGNTRKRNDGRSFAAIALIAQFGEKIIGIYELERFNQDMAILKKVEGA